MNYVTTMLCFDNLYPEILSKHLICFIKTESDASIMRKSDLCSRELKVNVTFRLF